MALLDFRNVSEVYAEGYKIQYAMFNGDVVWTKRGRFNVNNFDGFRIAIGSSFTFPQAGTINYHIGISLKSRDDKIIRSTMFWLEDRGIQIQDGIYKGMGYGVHLYAFNFKDPTLKSYYINLFGKIDFGEGAKAFMPYHTTVPVRYTI